MKNTIKKKENVYKENFSKRLIQVMLDHGHVSQKNVDKPSAKQLADASGVSRTMANRYINGLSIPETKILHKMAEWLNCDPWWLLNGNKKQGVHNNTKISPTIAKFILLALREMIGKGAANEKDFSLIIDDFIEIYNNISDINGDISAKLKSAEIMTNFIKR